MGRRCPEGADEGQKQGAEPCNFRRQFSCRPLTLTSPHNAKSVMGRGDERADHYLLVAMIFRTSAANAIAWENSPARQLRSISAT